METRDLQRIYFDFTTVFSNTKMYIDSYNARQNKLTDKLNANHRATAEWIVRLYVKQLNRIAQIEELTADNLPGFCTYNTSLAGCKGCTQRTIINHRERLKQAKVIIREERKGAGGVEMWINPQIIRTSLFSLKVKKIHTLVHELQEQKNINSSVDKSGVRPAHSHGLSAGTPSTASPADKATGTQEHHKNTEENVALAFKDEQCSAKNQEQVSDEAGRIFLLSLVRQFWEYARKVLYPGIILSDPEEREILNLIWASVYGKFRLKATEAELLDYHESAITRVDIVARWLSRNGLHWIPKPHLYFHPNNDRNGFKKTWQWYVKQQILKLEVRNQLLIQQIKAEWQQHRAGRGRFKQKTRLQLFRVQQKRLSQYRDESLMQAFHLCLQRSLHLKKLKDNAF